VQQSADAVLSAVQQGQASVWNTLQKACLSSFWNPKTPSQQQGPQDAPGAADAADTAAQQAMLRQQQESLARQLQLLLQQHQQELAAQDAAEAEAMRQTLHQLAARVLSMQGTAGPGASPAPPQLQQQQSQQLAVGSGHSSMAEGVVGVLRELLQVNRQILDAPDSQAGTQDLSDLMARFQEDLQLWRDSQIAAAAAAAAAAVEPAAAGSLSSDSDSGAACSLGLQSGATTAAAAGAGAGGGGSAGGVLLCGWGPGDVSSLMWGLGVVGFSPPPQWLADMQAVSWELLPR
jgi:hypothetical protein